MSMRQGMSILLATSSITLGAQSTARAVDTVPLQRVQLWEATAPMAKGQGAEDRPALDVLKAAKPNGAAIIICPGGGYRIRAMDHEGLQVAQWLNEQGITAFVLSYRLRPSGYDTSVSLLDARRAVRLVRSRAASFGIDPTRIGMMGFSAGAHLASWVGEVFDGGNANATDAIEKASDRPNFLALVYGQPSQQETQRNPRPVSSSTPPTFMLNTLTDFVDPGPSTRHLQALRSAKVEAELHVFGGDGGHGRGLHRGDPDTGVWPNLLLNWMRRNAFLCQGPRASVEGSITIDGVPLFLGWITLIPTDPNLPTASVYWNDVSNKGPAFGHYLIETRYGPLPGRYRVEVRRQAKDLLTVPSMPREEVFTRLAPDQTPLTIEIKPGSNRLDLAIRTH